MSTKRGWKFLSRNALPGMRVIPMIARSKHAAGQTTCRNALPGMRVIPIAEKLNAATALGWVVMPFRA